METTDITRPSQEDIPPAKFRTGRHDFFEAEYQTVREG